MDMDLDLTSGPAKPQEEGDLSAGEQLPACRVSHTSMEPAVLACGERREENGAVIYNRWTVDAFMISHAPRF